MQVFLNGNFVPEKQAVVPASDRGFLLGDGLFETMRVAGGRPFRFAQHLERLARGADFLKIKCPFTPEALETLTRGPGGRGYAPNGKGRPTVVMTLHPAPSLEHSIKWSLVTSSFRIPAADPLASFKTTSKILHIMARAEAAERGADEALLLNTTGEVAETAGGNLFWIHDDTICTPPAGSGALPGVTRAVVLEICRTLGLKTSERASKPEALRNSVGLFITQSALGIVAVTAFDGAPVTPSPLMDRIARVYHQMLVRPTV